MLKNKIINLNNLFKNVMKEFKEDRGRVKE
jgi:hypothetical protein